MSVFFVCFCFFGAKIWPAAADTGELGWDLRDPTLRFTFSPLAGTQSTIVLSPLAGSDILSRWVHFKRPRPRTDLILLVITSTIQV